MKCLWRDDLTFVQRTTSMEETLESWPLMLLCKRERERERQKENWGTNIKGQQNLEGRRDEKGG